MNQVNYNDDNLKLFLMIQAILFGGLGGLIYIGLIVGVIITLVWNRRIAERLERVEQQLRGNTHIQVAPQKEIIQKEEVYEEPEYEEEEEIIPPAPPGKPFSLEDFLGRRFFSILGIVSIVLALIFFASWAFANGYIGPKGQVAIGIIVGLVFLVTGEVFRNKYPKFFPVLSSVGVAGLLAITFVASNVYGFISPSQSFIAYIIEISAGILLALRYDSRVLGNFSIIGGLLAPVLIQSPEPNAIGLFTFLSLLAIAGFLVSTRKRWSEILAVLFIGISVFEVQILNMKLLSTQPIVFLSFLFGMHYLLGSGGLIRCIRDKAEQSLSKISFYDTLETLIFIFSVLVANIIAYNIFVGQEWSNFGFFALAQGFLIYGYASIAKKYNLELFQKLFLATTLAVILFATGWEIGVDQAFPLTLAFLVEGSLFCFAAKKTNEKLFQFFGCIALGLAFCWIVQIKRSAIGQSAFLSLGLIGALAFSLRYKFSNVLDKIWPTLAFILASIAVIYWNFELLERLIPRDNKFLVYLVPMIFGCSVAYSVIKTQNNLSRILGLIFIYIINLFFFADLFDTLYRAPEFLSFLALLMILIGNFTAWTTYFISDDEKIPYSKLKQNIATIVTLSFSSLGVLFWGTTIDEPMRSISWVIWTIILISLGIKNDWNWFRYFGIGTLCILIAKWYLVDIWDLAIWIKFVAFGALGVGLLLISFWYQKKAKQ